MKAFLILFVLTSFFLEAKADNEQMVNDLNPDLFSKDFSEYDQQTSLFCSQLSEIAYWDSMTIDHIYKEVIHAYPTYNVQYEFIEDKQDRRHIQALLWGTKEFIVIAFRGTEPTKFKDWFGDAKYWNYENAPVADEELARLPPGHGGFRNSCMRLITKKNIFDKLEKFIKRCKPDASKSEFPIYTTGHSLGAALSQMMIEPFNYRGFQWRGAYHFAPPLAVSCQQNEEMTNKYGGRCYDIVNYKDYIPRAGRNNVAHFGKFYRVCDDGLLYMEKESYIKMRRAEYLKFISYHSLANHITAIRSSLNSNEQINLRSTVPYPCLMPRNEVPSCVKNKKGIFPK